MYVLPAVCAQECGKAVFEVEQEDTALINNGNKWTGATWNDAKERMTLYEKEFEKIFQRLESNKLGTNSCINVFCILFIQSSNPALGLPLYFLKCCGIALLLSVICCNVMVLKKNTIIY